MAKKAATKTKTAKTAKPKAAASAKPASKGTSAPSKSAKADGATKSDAKAKSAKTTAAKSAKTTTAKSAKTTTAKSAKTTAAKSAKMTTAKSAKTTAAKSAKMTVDAKSAKTTATGTKTGTSGKTDATSKSDDSKTNAKSTAGKTGKADAASAPTTDGTSTAGGAAREAAGRGSSTKSKKSPAGETIAVSITMKEPCMPIDRGERYEDPLFELLEAKGLGGAGDGGGTLTGADNEILEIDFDVEITSLDAIPVITKQLEEAGAPRGSTLQYGDTKVTFGASEGIAIYLDGVGQSAEVYKTTSADELVDKILAVAPTAQLRGSWQGPVETALYFYGDSADALWKSFEPVLRAYPLSRNARVVLRHGNPKPKQIKLKA